jgi:hypothetical protein
VADTRGDKYHFKYWPPGLERFWPSCDWAFASLNGWVDAVKADRTPKDADVACKIAFVPQGP